MRTFDLDGPILRSRLEPDFYKFTMGQVIWRKYGDVRARFALRNRTAQVKLGRVLDLGELREQLDHARRLAFTDDELHYLRGLTAGDHRLFGEEYIAFLRRLRLPDYELERRGDGLVLAFPGLWAETTYWETMALSVVNETYYRTLLRRLTAGERASILAEGIRRLEDKIRTLRQRPDIAFSDFGTRRRFAAAWQYHVDEVLRDELNHGAATGQFLGTSNTHAAMALGLVPMGTSAHELPMIVAGMLDPGDADPQWLRRAQRQVLDDWWNQYGWALSIFLPDTFGTDLFFSVVTAQELRNWKGFRWDSGDLFAFGDRVIEAYRGAGVDPLAKLLVPSDALDLSLILRAQDHFGSRIRVSYGWGTGLTNDLLDNVMRGGDWFGPMSIVIKPAEANGRGLVKLSDNPAKAMGRPEDIERYKLAAAYGEHESVSCKY